MTKGLAVKRRGGEEEAEYLTSAEVARRLRLNPKKVYALLAAGRLPAARVSGKWLFPRVLVDQWVAEHTVYPSTGLMGALIDRLLVVQGSDDWVLGNALDALRVRQGKPVAAASIGSVAGLRALADGSAHAAGLHVEDEAVRPLVPAGGTWYLYGLGTREQGLMFPRELRARVTGPDAVAEHRLRLADRQPDSGTYRLTRRLFSAAGADADILPRVGPFASHLEVGLAVRTGAADVGMGVRLAAEMCGLDFLLLARETYRLAVPDAYMAHGRLGGFLEGLFDEFDAARKKGVAGYTFESLGRMRPVRRAEKPAGAAREVPR